MFGKNKINKKPHDGLYKVVTVSDDLEQFEIQIGELLANKEWQLTGGISVTQIDAALIYSQALTKIQS